VPEGYKTGSYSALALFSDPTSPSISNPNPPAHHPPAVKKTGTRPRARELTPFCGILKVGGMAQQQWGIYNPGGHGQEIEQMEEDVEEEDEVPLLSSQGSTISNISTESAGYGQGQFGNLGGGNKRRFNEDDEGDMAVRNFGLGQQRVIAVPRRKSGKKFNRLAGSTVFGQENDFDDAEFLDYNLASEVEMGGV
jgi:hypothetical protein